MEAHDQHKGRKFFSRNKRKIFLFAIPILLVTGIAFLIYYSRTQVDTSKDPTIEISAENAVSPVDPQIENGIHVQSGLVDDEGLYVVIGSCTSCHSSALILQNRYSREGWHERIEWMQETQGLWDLGENEDIILDYLASNYAPEEPRGRRKPLKDIQWYELKE
ncbi:monoheme cytochrome C [Antarcticibacterium sp. 1MA-6-2]|uniref:monoheme cytochrome C n=1 Tax=Antarcticibacterium sp. 1MA-6-2 TaxID=2908210 RepID=UPI001F21D032|nr:monoheme cytochrome C [Antarcticibacterium sp. 1MA-6-2]UJH92817.1 monoheme cytochrome C [Antarcticibacterium sp. 1MA-6-2]